MARPVLLLYTGGTLGMMGTPLEPGRFAEALEERAPRLAEIAELDSRLLSHVDSSDIGPAQWTELAEAIAGARGSYQGVVIVHGTDTMAFTASALAFALQGLDLPVVLTGAQRPLVATRTDAQRNLQDAVEAATGPVCEVSICFDGLLLRGCRAVKNDARTYRAFESPGVPPLARFGVEVDVASHVRAPSGDFLCRSGFDPRVALLYVTPGLDPALVDRFAEANGLHGIVLAAFGVGTVPRTQGALGPAIERAVRAGTDVLVVSQRGGMIDLGRYKNSVAVAEAGAIPGGFMQIEAAVPKLMHALANYDDPEERRAYLQTDVAGEYR